MNRTTKQLLTSSIVATAIFSSLAIPQVQVKANQFLSLFRVDQVEMVKLTQNDLREIENWVSENKEGTLDLKGIGELEISDTSEEPKYFETYELAKESGYHIPKLEGFVVEGVKVTPASTITFTLNVENTNQILSQLGSNYQFEALLDGKPFTVSTYEAIKTDYKMKDQRISYMRTKSPEIKVPEGVSIGELRNTLLSLPFLPNNVKEQLAGIHNFETTMPIPFVETEEYTASKVDVGNSKGVLVESEQKSAIIWQENGNIHTIVSEGEIGADELPQLVKQMN
ncbi:DUF4367 domain-containing protein [Oceanobacillus senegalensis]|uniref:DUF4367 domain-containing protein n=1 Tax=Oceanobacillus senegalensis TaxID=1936063 RepID=UPI000A305B57|nr:DUF4367 domain-containing protein [Oceanobacillus senegalensis]